MQSLTSDERFVQSPSMARKYGIFEREYRHSLMVVLSSPEPEREAATGACVEHERSVVAPEVWGEHWKRRPTKIRTEFSGCAGRDIEFDYSEFRFGWQSALPVVVEKPYFYVAPNVV